MSFLGSCCSCGLRLKDSVDDDLKASPHLLQKGHGKKNISCRGQEADIMGGLYLPTRDDLILWQDEPVGPGVTEFGGESKPECFLFEISNKCVILSKNESLDISGNIYDY